MLSTQAAEQVKLGSGGSLMRQNLQENFIVVISLLRTTQNT